MNTQYHYKSSHDLNQATLTVALCVGLLFGGLIGAVLAQHHDHAQLEDVVMDRCVEAQRSAETTGPIETWAEQADAAREKAAATCARMLYPTPTANHW